MVRHTVAKGRGNQGDWAPQVIRKPDRPERRAILAAMLGMSMSGLGGLPSRGRDLPMRRSRPPVVHVSNIHPDQYVSTFARKQRRRSAHKRLPGYGYKRKAAQ